jgi:peptidyl-prolyl cis-trans isomerase C
MRCRPALVSTLALWSAIAAAGCGDKPAAAPVSGAGQRAEASKSGKAGDEQVLARIDGQVITAAELQERLDALDPYSRSRFSAPEQKRKFLENMVRFEVLAREAQSRGYDRDPEVQRALKNQMISTLLQKELDDKLKPEDIPAPEVERYYREHPEEFKQPEQVRISQVFSADAAKAERAAAAARALQGKPEAEKAFRELVAQLSEDEDSKSRGGDLTFFDRNTAMYPRPLVEAAFALGGVGQVSAPVKTERGYHVLMLTQRRPGFTRALPEVTRDIRRQLIRDRRAKKMEELVAEMRKRLKVEVYEDRLAKVVPHTTSAPGGQP